MFFSTAARVAADEPVSFQVHTAGASCTAYGTGRPIFTVCVPSEAYWQWLSHASEYQAGEAFVRGGFRVEGNLLQAIRWWRRSSPHASTGWVYRALNRLRLENVIQSRRRARSNIRFHYDRSNAFYQQFLDRRMVYSCAYFEDPSWSLDAAQTAKLDHICRKLGLDSESRFLDIGCGWGALVLRAADAWGARACGCTLSEAQYTHGTAAARALGLAERVTIRECDYRELDGSFDAIASVGMFEHVGRHRLPEYFSTVARLLRDDGLFLNHGIVRPAPIPEDASTAFLRRRVFPGGELAPLADVIRAAVDAGFEVLDVENLRPHYALTCAAWIERLQRNENACLAAIDAETYRTWLLYLAGACVSFERAEIEIHQILLAKRSPASTRAMSRAYMYTERRPTAVHFSELGPQLAPAADERIASPRPPTAAAAPRDGSSGSPRRSIRR